MDTLSLLLCSETCVENRRSAGTEAVLAMIFREVPKQTLTNLWLKMLPLTQRYNGYSASSHSLGRKYHRIPARHTLFTQHSSHHPFIMHWTLFHVAPIQHSHIPSSWSHSSEGVSQCSTLGSLRRLKNISSFKRDRTGIETDLVRPRGTDSFLVLPRRRRPGMTRPPASFRSVFLL
jgi:hypothetical protein